MKNLAFTLILFFLSFSGIQAQGLQRFFDR